MSALAGAEVRASRRTAIPAVRMRVMESIVVQLSLSPVKSHHYSQHAAALRTELGHTLTRGQMLAFHAKDARRHLLVAARQFAILALATWGLIAIANPLIWIPLAFVQGFTVFNFTVLLH